MADVETARQTDQVKSSVEADIPANILPHLKARWDHAMPAGNEGAGVVIAAGDEPAAALVGKTVGVLGGAMKGSHRTLHYSQCLPMHDGVTPKRALPACQSSNGSWDGRNHVDGGFFALIHTAAASNLGQMLQKICIADDVKLVNIVRKEEQATLLRNIGADFVCNMSDANFVEISLKLSFRQAYLAFDATGGTRKSNSDSDGGSGE